jgi:energy-coupling factor transporter transmembrane protein EcfT
MSYWLCLRSQWNRQFVVDQYRTNDTVAHSLGCEIMTMRTIKNSYTIYYSNKPFLLFLYFCVYYIVYLSIKPNFDLVWLIFWSWSITVWILIYICHLMCFVSNCVHIKKTLKFLYCSIPNGLLSSLGHVTHPFMYHFYVQSTQGGNPIYLVISPLIFYSIPRAYILLHNVGMSSSMIPI